MFCLETILFQEFRRPILNRNIMFRVGSRVIGRCMSELVRGLHQPVRNIGIDTICDGVLLRMLLAKRFGGQTSAKLAPEFVGPFIIGKRTGTCNYELQDESGVSKGVWHVQDLKPMYSGRFSSDADVVRVTSRSKEVLRKKYENLKKRVKKKVSGEKSYNRATGGGPPLTIQLSDLESNVNKSLRSVRVEGALSELLHDALDRKYCK
ncbi:hypothetical protein HUJ04_001425 [Dendroctonus ponderosae]|nr:hypothetical protein HUJ04_001425 [Dendroctonus ponderosae]